MDSTPNLIRSIADVVSLDGWTEEVEDGIQIHADVVFRTAAVGGDQGDVVRFRLSLFRAELVGIIRNTEGLKLKPSSVSRDRVQRKITVSKQHESGRSTQRGIEGRIGASGAAFIPGVAANYLNKRSKRTSRSFSESMEMDNIAVQHRKGNDGHHRWELVCGDGQILRGSGWDSNEAPRFEIEKPRASKLDRCILFQIRCLREDMHFEDIELIPINGKPVRLLEKTDRNKLAAVEAYIKTKLVEHGLLAGDLGNPFTEICLLETTVEV